ncbi:hypothetical protein NKH93_33580 [Mesorhizobium sp. M0954]|uniref:hypothetical protein n=1 Tax=Mesorhizobium sp. M0954 TaxID=2957032 RepID=UPI00333608AA
MRDTLPPIANPDLVTLFDNKARWNLPDYRPSGFHNLHTTMRYAMSLRAPGVLPLRKEVDRTIGERPEVTGYLAMPHFSAFVVVRDDRILYEAYAPDFGFDRPHPVEAAGLKGRLHITCDREAVPLVDGGACLTARDLVRYELLFARKQERGL